MTKQLKLETIIGLEIHVQLKTQSKMFCACANESLTAKPNTNVCPVCLGHPGTLPVINMEAVNQGVRLALGLNFSISRKSKFDRKNYFYPDLPKGYQITQFDKPIAKDGYLIIRVEGEDKRFKIERLHLEEDAAKNIHQDGSTLVDFNRGGAPLAEIVTNPDFRSPQEAKKFLQELQLIARYLNVSDADMEKGQMRCDANISLRKVGEPGYNPKTEIKNLNSFRSVERALEYEIKRQSELWQQGQTPNEQTTRGWDEKNQQTVLQRSKEASNDYRYFPEPDLPLLEFSQTDIDNINAYQPELPHAKRLRFKDEYDLKYADAEVLTASLPVANYFEEIMTEVRSWLLDSGEIEGTEEEIWAGGRKKLSRMVFSWLTTELFKHLNNDGVGIENVRITAENFAEFIVLLHQSKVNSSAAQKIFETMYKNGGDPSEIAEGENLMQLSDEGELIDMVRQVLVNEPEMVKQYQAGKTAFLRQGFSYWRNRS